MSSAEDQAALEEGHGHRQPASSVPSKLVLSALAEVEESTGAKDQAAITLEEGQSRRRLSWISSSASLSSLRNPSSMEPIEDQAAISLEEGQHHRRSTSESLKPSDSDSRRKTRSRSPTPSTGQEPPDIIQENIGLVDNGIGVRPSGGGTLKPKSLHGLRFAAQDMGTRGYKKKYAADERYKEAEPDARVWQVYNDESEIFDGDMISDASSNLDILLIFAGLFSSVVTAFVIQSSQALSPDPASISNSLLSEIVALQRAQANRTSFDLIPNADISFIASHSDIWVNALWTTSLTLSLFTALLAVVSKQWLRQYTSIILGSNRERACTRQFRFDNFEKWKVHLIIGLLPTILHLALFLFVIGLVVFMFPLNHALANFLAAITGLLCIAYITASILPVFLIQCPYRTSLSDILYSVYVLTHPIIKWIHKSAGVESPTLSPSLKSAEHEAVIALRSSQFFRTLMWLTYNSPDLSVKAIIAESWGAVYQYAATPFSKANLGASEAKFQKSLYNHFHHIFSRFRSGTETPDDEASFGQLILAASGPHRDLYIHDLWGFLVKTSDFHTMLAVAACGRTIHFQQKAQDKPLVLAPYDVFNFVVKISHETSDIVHAPCWVWQSLCAQAADHNKFIDANTTIEELRHIEKYALTEYVEKYSMALWMEELHLPITFQHSVLKAPLPNEYLKHQESQYEDIIHSQYSVIPLPTFLKHGFMQIIEQKFQDCLYSFTLADESSQGFALCRSICESSSALKESKNSSTALVAKLRALLVKAHKIKADTMERMEDNLKENAIADSKEQEQAQVYRIIIEEVDRAIRQTRREVGLWIADPEQHRSLSRISIQDLSNSLHSLC